ncbi:MAG: hypothetical protein WAL67_17340 [Candidatus Cybelea sp.]
MPKRSGKAPSSDPDRAGFEVVEQDTADEAEILRDIEESTTDPAAVPFGHRGGLKGGPARKAAQAPQQRKKAAQKPAKTRSNKKAR